MFDNLKGKHRLAWERIEQRSVGAPHCKMWDHVSQCKNTIEFPWFRIMDRVTDQAWRLFSPEVSGNRL